jgi:hypothetical protein
MSKGSSIRLRARVGVAGTAAAVLVAFGVCEAMGWPFLAGPMQRWLGGVLDRRVALSADRMQPPQTTIHLFGGITIATAYLEIGAPRWSTAPRMLTAHDAKVRVGYADLWRASRGAELRIHELSARQLDGRLERLADGRASWQFGDGARSADPSAALTHFPAFGRLQVDAGTMTYRDTLLEVDLDSTFSLVDETRAAPADAGVAPASAGLTFNAKGSYRKNPLTIDARAAGVLSLVGDDRAPTEWPVEFRARIGAVTITFKGSATDAIHLDSLAGRFSVQGPSLATAGDLLRVTLPTTAPFRTGGLLVKRGKTWYAVIEQAQIGASRLSGAFTYDRQPRVPMLAGRLTGSTLLLADLGPAIGTVVASASASAASAKPPRSASRRVLPNRPFDLPSLRAMDANVLVDIDSLDLGSSILEPLRPLRAHLVLADGVLTLRELDARTGQGTLAGTVRLDGREAQARWSADLRWAGVHLESWIHQVRRKKGASPYATGELDGQVRVAGEGGSTAAILGSLQGGMRMQLANGTISHLAVEAAGLDIAQALGVYIKGDDALPILCNLAAIDVNKGVLRPSALVLDTRDSTLWADGSLSLATETIDMRVIVAPKDFSPLALRTPLHLRGSFADPSVSIEKGKVGVRLAAAAVLALVNPLAALIPLVDVGDVKEARKGADACQALVQRAKAAPARAHR